MLLTVEGLYDDLKDDFSEFVTYKESESIAFPKVLARRFFYEFAVLNSKSLRFSRTRERKSRMVAKGRIATVQTKINLRMKKAEPVVCDYLKRDYSTPENRLLAAAAYIGLSYCQPNGAIEKVAEKWIKRFLNWDALQNDLDVINKKLRQNKFAGSRGYYTSCLTLAKLLLGQSGFSQGDSAHLQGDAILINTSTLFEDYIRSVLKNSYKGNGLNVRKGGVSANFLYQSGDFQLIPDICICKGNDYLLIGDVKYKNPSASDHYQMYSYLRTYKVNKGVLLAPVYNSGELDVLKRYTKDGKLVVEIKLPIQDLDVTEQALSQLHEYVSFAH